jgi:hypothetical protein
VLNTAAKIGAAVLIDGGRRLRIGSTVSVPSNTRLNGGGSTLTNATPGSSGRMLRIAKVHDVTIDYINFDGEKNNHLDATEQRHNVIVSGSHNVTLDRMRSFNAKGDGLYIGDQLSGPSVNVTVTNSMFDQNHRQGMSITCVSGLTVTDCHFGSTAGTAPQAGVDIEPNAAESIIENMTFRNCSFMNNVGGGLQVYLHPKATVAQSAGTYIGCQFSENSGASGISLINSRELNIIGGEIRGNDRDGLSIISANATHLKKVAIAENGHAGVAAVWAFLNLTLTECLLDGNGTAADKTYFGVDCAPATGEKGYGLLIDGSIFRNMYGGVRTSSATSHVTLIDNSYRSLTIDKKLADNIGTRIDAEGTRTPSPQP